MDLNAPLSHLPPLPNYIMTPGLPPIHENKNQLMHDKKFFHGTIRLCRTN